MNAYLVRLKQPATNRTTERVVTAGTAEAACRKAKRAYAGAITGAWYVFELQELARMIE